jgi:hypothetical protein
VRYPLLRLILTEARSAAQHGATERFDF